MHYWQTKRIRLREFETEDADLLLTWRSDAEAMRQLDLLEPPVSGSWIKTVIDRKANQNSDDDSFRLVIEEASSKKALGTIAANGWDRRAGVLTYGLMIISEERHKGYATEAIGLVLRYFFEELRYQKATVTMYANNDIGIALHKKLGFTEEGKLRRMAFTKGEYVDVVVLGITHEEWREKFPYAELQNGAKRKTLGFLTS